MLLFAGSKERALQLSQNLTGWGHANFSYRQAGTFVPPPELRVLPEPFPDSAEYCASTWPGIAHFYVPWHHNLFHLHNSNLLALAAVLLSDPACGSAAELPCIDGPQRRLFALVASGHSLAHSELLQIIFGDRESPRAASELLEGGPHCVGGVSWGPGPMMLTIDGRTDWMVREMIATMNVLRDAALRHLQIQLPQRSHSNSPNVVLISRDPQHVRGLPRTGTGRYFRDVQPLLHALQQAGASQTKVCCDFSADGLREFVETSAQADIVIGLHGAGNANALYAREGVLVVELHGGYSSYGQGDNTMYQRVADARQGTWLSLRLMDPAEHELSASQAKDLAKCVLAAWRGRVDECRSSKHFVRFGERKQQQLRSSVPRNNGSAIKWGPIAPCEATRRCPSHMMRMHAALRARVGASPHDNVPKADL